MSDPPGTDLISTCTSLAVWAMSGAREIEGILLDRVDEVRATEFQKLQLLSTKLEQSSKDADQLQGGLKRASVISTKLQTVVSAQLSECDATAAIVIKQLMRVGQDTPREAISVAAILQYEAFSESTMRFLFFTTQLLSIDSVEGQEAKLGVEDAQLLLAEVGSACRDIARSGGILLDTESSSSHSVSKQDLLDTLPPEYETQPPPFEESHNSVYGEPAFVNAGGGGCSNSNSNNNNSGSSNGFWSSLANSFTAATTALRTKPEPLVVALCQTTMIGNVPQLRSILDEGVNINGRNDNGRTALICAILADQLDAVQLLLGAGADHSLCSGGRKGKPPLFHAIDAENKAAADLLFKHGAAANQSDEWGQPYFVHLITGETAPEWIALLLSHGADACAKDVSGRPVVILALQNRKKHEDREEVVRLLLRYGANPDSRDMDGTPLIYFCTKQKRDGLVHELLAMGADPNACDVSGIPLLATAMKHNNRLLAKALLERRADPNAPDIYGSYLILTVICDNEFPAADREALAEMLLQHGAHGDKKDSWGVTALEHSLAPILEGIATPSLGGTKLKIPELLLKQGADPNQRLKKVSGEPTLLTYALDRAQWDILTMALRHGANANLADKEGRTPLVLAVQKGNEDAVALLMQQGANPNQPRQMLPLDVAIAMGNPKIIQLLKAHGAVSSTSPVGNGTGV